MNTSATFNSRFFFSTWESNWTKTNKMAADLLIFIRSKLHICRLLAMILFWIWPVQIRLESIFSRVNFESSTILLTHTFYSLVWTYSSQYDLLCGNKLKTKRIELLLSALTVTPEAPEKPETRSMPEPNVSICWLSEYLILSYCDSYGNYDNCYLLIINCLLMLSNDWSCGFLD